jgi:NTE family protein
MKRCKIGLALSGGIAKSAAHVGVLKALEEHGVGIDCVSGTSGGSIVGAFYAAGKSVDEMARLAGTLRWVNLAGLTLPRLGLLSSEKIRRFVVDEIGDLDFNELDIPLAVVAADISSGAKKVFTEGKVAVACQASSSIPELYAPVELDHHSLVDGSLVEHVPVEALGSFGGLFKIGVNLGYEREGFQRPRNLLEVVTQVTNFIAQQNAAVSERLADFMIRPDLREFSLFALHKASDMIDRGYAEALRAMPDLEVALNKFMKTAS